MSGTLFLPRDLPWAPIGELCTRRGISDAALGERCGAGTIANARRMVARWKRQGLTVWEADRAATALGLHPALVWGDAWSEASHEPDRAAAAFFRLRMWMARQAAA